MIEQDFNSNLMPNHTDSVETILNNSFIKEHDSHVALDKAGLSIEQVQDFSERYRQATDDVSFQQMDFQISIGVQGIVLMGAIAIVNVLLVSGILTLVPAEMTIGWKAFIAISFFIAGISFPGGFIMKKFFKHYLHKGLKKATDYLESLKQEALVMDNSVLQQELFAFFKQNQPDLFDKMSSSYTVGCNNFKEHIEKKEFALALCDMHNIFKAIPDLDQRKYRQLIEHYPELKLASLNAELKNRL
jgi:hypothetical protein